MAFSGKAEFSTSFGVHTGSRTTDILHWGFLIFRKEFFADFEFTRRRFWKAEGTHIFIGPKQSIQFIAPDIQNEMKILTLANPK